MQMNVSTGPQFRRRDVAEIAIGACIMAFPVTVTEEVWDLGTELMLWRVLLFALASVCFLTIFIYVLQDHAEFPLARSVLLKRVLSTYGITLLICALLLYGIDRLDLLHNPVVGLKRTILVAFPASFAATAVDNFGGNTQGN